MPVNHSVSFIPSSNLPKVGVFQGSILGHHQSPCFSIWAILKWIIGDDVTVMLYIFLHCQLPAANLEMQPVSNKNATSLNVSPNCLIFLTPSVSVHNHMLRSHKFSPKSPVSHHPLLITCLAHS